MIAGAPQTPQAAALAFVQPKIARTRASVRIIGQSSTCAVLQFKNGLIVSTLASGQIIVRKFRFGWQAVGLDTGTSKAAKCSGSTGQSDVGSPADVSTVRSFMAGAAEIVPFVRVIDNYAFLQWWGNGGGENFYKKTATGWKKIVGGGGAVSPDELHHEYGVPLTIAHALLRQ